jgi:ketosteroid isomerase-like protein
MSEENVAPQGAGPKGGVAIGRETAAAFVDGYGRTWESWDVPAFVDLFSNDVVYVAHSTQETVVGREALKRYLQKEATEQGEVSVCMGEPVIEGDRVAAEFWVTARSEGEAATITGCLIARLASDGRCADFREYWFDIEGHHSAFEGWGE